MLGNFRDSEGYYIDFFDDEKKVKMSTYLFAIAIGELDYVEGYYKDIRVYCIVFFKIFYIVFKIIIF